MKVRTLVAAAALASAAGVLVAAPASATIAAPGDVTVQATCGVKKSGRTATGTCTNLGGRGWRLGIRCKSGGLIQHFYNPPSGYTYNAGTLKKTCPGSSKLTHAWIDLT